MLTEILSLRFFLLFFPVVIIYYLLPGKYRYIWLLVVSMFFYAFTERRRTLFIVLIILSTYIVARLLPAVSSQTAKVLTSLMIAVIVSMMIFLRYIGLFLPKFDGILPIGISFFSLAAMGYVIDIYRGSTAPESNIGKYALFLSFFSIVVSGPVERSTNLLKQIDEGRSFDYEKAKRGLLFIAWGIYEKAAVADTIAPLVNNLFDNYEQNSCFGIVVATLLFSVQLYADFDGYSNIAVGLAGVLGFDIIHNFKRPYFSRDIREFWQRWHISLSNWLRDYVYIPLGGSKHGKSRTYINLIVTFLISGFWHGKGLNFLVWGMIHGVYQIAGRISSPIKAEKRPQDAVGMKSGGLIVRMLQAVGVFLLTTIAWFFFRAENLHVALSMLGYLFRAEKVGQGCGMTAGTIASLFFAGIPVLIVDVLHERGVSLSVFLSKQTLLLRWTVYFSIAIVLTVVWFRAIGDSATTFLYAGF